MPTDRILLTQLLSITSASPGLGRNNDILFTSLRVLNDGRFTNARVIPNNAARYFLLCTILEGACEAFCFLLTELLKKTKTKILLGILAKETDL